MSRPRPFAVFLAVLLLWLAASWYVVGALLGPVIPGHGWSIAALALVTTAAPPAAFFTTRARGVYHGALFRLLIIRPFWYAVLLWLLLGVLGLGGALVGWPFGAAGVAGRIAIYAATAFFLAAAVAGYAGSRRLVVKHLEAVFPDLPAGLDGLRVVQISDVHVGPHTPRRHLARVATAVREAAPDLIAITGDLVDDHAADVAHFAEGLGKLEAPLGVYVIPGNHDVYAGWEAVRAQLAALPVAVLVNAGRVLERGGDRFAVVGTGDPAGRQGRASWASAAPDLDAALVGVPPGTFVLALAHNPALWPALARRNSSPSLTLSGHTHWGQLAIPRLGWSLAGVFLDLAMGAYRNGRSLLYIHPGTNYWGIPFRIGAPSEVAVITVRRGNETGMRLGG